MVLTQLNRGYPAFFIAGHCFHTTMVLTQLCRGNEKVGRKVSFHTTMVLTQR